MSDCLCDNHSPLTQLHKSSQRQYIKLSMKRTWFADFCSGAMQFKFYHNFNQNCLCTPEYFSFIQKIMASYNQFNNMIYTSNTFNLLILLATCEVFPRIPFITDKFSVPHLCLSFTLEYKNS